MAAPKGNQFWKLRSKHGRDKLFSTPKILWEESCNYFQWVDENPLIEIVIEKKKVNGIGDKIVKEQLPKMRPYTLHGLCLYLDCSTSYFREFKSSERGKDKDFMAVITRIEEIVYNQKFEGASSGFFNANIISRDLGLIDKKETELKGGLNIPNLPDIGKRK